MALKVVDFDADIKLRVLSYGIAGSGKTTFAASAARDHRTSPCLHIDIGGNALSLRRFPTEQRPTVVAIAEMSDLNPLYDWLKRGQPAQHPFVNATGLAPGFKSLVFDGITGLQRESFAKVTGATSKGPGDVPDTFEWPHYNKVLGHMTRFATLFFSLPMHVIVTALERSKDDKATGNVMYGPLLLGQAAEEVAGYAFVVMRMVHRLRLTSAQLKAADAEASQLRIGEDATEGQAVSVGMLAPSGKYVAKDQHGINKPYLVNPTVTAMLDAMGVK